MSVPHQTLEKIRQEQLIALNRLLARIIPANPFYTRKLLESEVSREFSSLEEFSRRFPFTTKQEIVQDQAAHPPYGRNLTFPLHTYTRLHQTSGTTGQPLRWLDTAESWNALTDCWMRVYHAAAVTSHDIVFFAFSFGPFLGFWLAFEAAARIGSLCVPGGGISSSGRLKMILDTRSTVLCCTPTYAMHLAETAAAERIDLSRSAVRLIIVAGEPGGSLPATRALIEKLWRGAKVFDHHGMTEMGPVTYECPAQPGRLHVMDSAYIAEIVSPTTGQPLPPQSTGELILTNLFRPGSPLLRYRTGDLVRLDSHHSEHKPCACGTYETTLDGGILGRTDDMVVVRGVNIYPSAIEQIVRQFPQVVEYQVNISKRGALTEMHVVIEPSPETKNTTELVSTLEKAFQTTFSLRIPVTAAPSRSLPRPELKARRWIQSS